MKNPLLLTALVIFILITGCSSNPSGSSSPVDPGLAGIASSSAGNSHVLWGLWHILIDPVTLTAEIIPLRGVDFNANVTKFLQPPASPVNMLTVHVLPGSTPSTGYFAVDVTIRHPFPSLPFYRGFDVRGIFISNGSNPAVHDPSLLYAGDGESRLLNADGWTRWWNPTEFTSTGTIFGYTIGKLGPPIFPTATLNGYKYFADGFANDASLSDLDIASRGTFTNSGVNTRTYKLQFKNTGGVNTFDFNYAVDASYNAPDPSYAPDYLLEAFNLSSNLQEAYSLSTNFDGSTAWYVDPSQNGGDLHVNIEVGDWQALSPDLTVADEVAAIWIECAGLGIDPIDVLPSASVSDGNGVTTSVFSFDIAGVTPSSADPQKMLVSVEASNPKNYKAQVPVGDNFDYPDKPLSAYMFFDAPVLDMSPDKNPIVTSIIPDVATIDSGDVPVQITGQFFKSDAYAQLIKNDDPSVILDASGESVNAGGTTIDCTFNVDSSNGAELGVYDLVVTNPTPSPLSGQLDDAFTIKSLTPCDEVYDTLLYSGSFNLYDLGTGTYENAFTRDGLILAKVNDAQGESLYGFDVAQNGPVDGVPVISAMKDGSNGVVKMDVDDFTGNILYMTSAAPNTINAYTETGSFIGTIDNQGTTACMCYDTDYDGGLWTVGYNDTTTYINHYTWDGSQYVYDPAGTVVSDELSNGVEGLTFDCAVSYTDRHLIIFNQSDYPWKGMLVIYDINSGTPVFMKVVDQFLPQMLGAHSYPPHRHACDIEIDHSVPQAESCRVAIMERCQPWEMGTTFLKMDTDGNIIDTYNFPDGYSLRQFFSIAINPAISDPDGAFLFCNRDFSYDGNMTEYDIYAQPSGW